MNINSFIYRHIKTNSIPLPKFEVIGLYFIISIEFLKDKNIVPNKLM